MEPSQLIRRDTLLPRASPKQAIRPPWPPSRRGLMPCKRTSSGSTVGSARSTTDPAPRMRTAVGAARDDGAGAVPVAPSGVEVPRGLAGTRRTRSGSSLPREGQQDPPLAAASGGAAASSWAAPSSAGGGAASSSTTRSGAGRDRATDSTANVRHVRARPAASSSRPPWRPAGATTTAAGQAALPPAHAASRHARVAPSSGRDQRDV